MVLTSAWAGCNAQRIKVEIRSSVELIIYVGLLGCCIDFVCVASCC